MNAQIRYIALKSQRPDELAEYYRHYFSMDELGRTDAGDVALTDGFYNLSLLKSDESNLALGFSHFGVAVDDLHELLVRMERVTHKTVRLSTEPGDLTHGEYRIIDPNINLPISLSTDSFGVPPLQAERQIPAIRHIALSVWDNNDHKDAIVDFFVEVFGFRRQEGTGAGVGDGGTALQILPYPVWTGELADEPVAHRHTRYGLNHFGWLVEDLELMLKSLPEGRTHKRPDTRPMTEWRTLDPEGNEQDISQAKGYQIDAGVWVNGTHPNG